MIDNNILLILSTKCIFFNLKYITKTKSQISDNHIIGLDRNLTIGALSSGNAGSKMRGRIDELQLFDSLQVKALSHITGGGLLENLPRVLPDTCSALIDTASWEWPEIFQWLQSGGNVATQEMYRTFNCGVGMVVCVEGEKTADTIALLQGAGHGAWEIGRIAEGNRQVELLP